MSEMWMMEIIPCQIAVRIMEVKVPHPTHPDLQPMKPSSRRRKMMIHVKLYKDVRPFKTS